MPSSACDFKVLAGNRPADTFYDLVKSDIVFECIGPRDVVIEGIPHAHDDSTCLIYAAFHGFEPNRHLHIFGSETFIDTDRKAVIGGIATRLRDDLAASGRRIFQHLPTNCPALACQPIREARRFGACRH